MIWEQDVVVIAMVTLEREGGKVNIWLIIFIVKRSFIEINLFRKWYLPLKRPVLRIYMIEKQERTLFNFWASKFNLNFEVAEKNHYDSK